jgi:protoheme IX farnesyltransferase
MSAAPPRSVGGTLRAYYELAKPRLSALAVFAVVAGCYMGYVPSASPPLRIVLGATVGTFLVAVAGSALNMYRERDYDALMARTQGRPLPSGRIPPAAALRFGVVAAVIGLAVLFLSICWTDEGATSLHEQVLQSATLAATHTQAAWLATGLCAVILLSYVLVYTPMKRTTTLNTFVGAIPGGLPPVVGYAAVTGRVTMGAVILFAILFCWQIPHFLAIAWRYRDDYARGGFRMLPVVDPGGERTKLTMLLYVAGLGIASLVPFVTQMAGEIYLGAAVCLDIFFFVPAVLAALTRYESAMRMTFLASLAYLPLLFTVMVLDRQIPR